MQVQRVNIQIVLTHSTTYTNQCMCSSMSYLFWEKCVSGCSVDLRLPGQFQYVSLTFLSPDSFTIFLSAVPLLPLTHVLLFIINHTCWLMVHHLAL